MNVHPPPPPINALATALSGYIAGIVCILCVACIVYLKKSLKIHEENTKNVTTVSVILYVIKFHVNLHTL